MVLGVIGVWVCWLGCVLCSGVVGARVSGSQAAGGQAARQPTRGEGCRWCFGGFWWGGSRVRFPWPLREGRRPARAAWLTRVPPRGGAASARISGDARCCGVIELSVARRGRRGALVCRPCGGRWAAGVAGPGAPGGSAGGRGVSRVWGGVAAGGLGRGEGVGGGAVASPGARVGLPPPPGATRPGSPGPGGAAPAVRPRAEAGLGSRVAGAQDASTHPPRTAMVVAEKRAGQGHEGSTRRDPSRTISSHHERLVRRAPQRPPLYNPNSAIQSRGIPPTRRPSFPNHPGRGGPHHRASRAAPP